MTIDKWQESYYLRVENKSDLVNGIDDLGKKAIIYKGLQPKANPTFRCLRPIDKEIRVPARFSSSAVYRYSTFIANGGMGNDEQSMNGFYGSGYYDKYIYNKSELLTYVPRMYVQLQKLSDFITDIGLTNHYHEYPIFNTPTASYTYGYKFNRVIHIPDNAYVLRAYSIYTNNTDGNNQTLLHSYDYTSKGYESPELYDMFVPCSVMGSSTGTNFIPYMRSLLPHYYADKSSLARYKYTAPLYVGINGAISGKISGAVNMVSVTGADDFSENPFMNTVIANYYPDYWATLTAGPLGEGIYYIAADLSTWKQLFTASGMPWSDNIDD